MPHDKIADRKGHQGWMKRQGQYFIFPGGGTMFPDGAVQYIQKLAQYIPMNGGVLRTALDMGCGVAPLLLFHSPFYNTFLLVFIPSGPKQLVIVSHSFISIVM